MNFGKILEKWEKNNKYYPLKDISEEKILPDKAENNLSILRKMRPQAVLDLHGNTGAEAEVKIKNFLADSRAQGLAKVLIVHGKGNHSVSGPVLKNITHESVRKSPYTGLSGIPDRKMGGSGALWIILK